ncbi:GntR family transcriptional regulator [Virgibacillus sp. 179-BFC.A HS]|uniref:GntR family transcriptional regulator n=1 Tax=Tigheibacillus jepli TaxID=3035914 RepID=A0ABU5CMU8_9BACI|nr:GntR family transcriptional regulator [Virgibacillus sp. 179-BFC.A HS]MDY0407157.1 GntR family transcriptional regulator [Virgibacillus sp. 179-BFC.A HS]
MAIAKKQSIKVQIYNHLKDAILSRQLPPGKQLVENDISETLKVSRTPVRAAIDLLANEGLDIKPNKGAFVTSPTRNEILQAYDLRKKLEIMAADIAIEHLSNGDFIVMEDCIRIEKEALFTKDMPSYLKANHDFHMVYTNKCGNQFLIRFIEKLINQTSIYLILFDIVFDKETSAVPYGYKEHREIMWMFKQRKRDELVSCLENHFDNAVKSLRTQNEYKDLKGIFR